MHTKRMQAGGRHGWPALTTVCAALALLVVHAPGATASPQPGPAGVGDGPVEVVSAQAPAEADGLLDTQEVLEYWTTARMEAAQPPWAPGSPLPGGMGFMNAGDDPAGPIATADPAHDTRPLTEAEVLAHPHRSVGKVFYTLLGFDFVCSASAVTTGGRWGAGSGQLIATAGHCVNDGDGEFASRVLFVPGYHDGAAPFGRWVAWKLFTTPEWNTGLGLAFGRDVAFARVTGTEDHAGARLDEVVTSLDIAFTQPYPEDGLNVAVQPQLGTRYAAFGYGVADWGGESQVRSRSEVVALDPFAPPPMGMPSTHTGGASGGPWLHNYAPGAIGEGLNVVNSVNSYVYAGVDRLFGPQFDDPIHGLWTFANLPGIAITDVEVEEGDAGTTEATFTVSLDGAGVDPVGVDFTTVPDDADAGIDYLTTAGTLVFPPGETSQEIVVEVLGDAVGEQIEYFTVELANPSHAFIIDGVGEGVILDDEPSLRIDPVDVIEGDEGITTARFPVTIEPASDLTVTLDYTTVPDTAESPDDFSATTGTLTFLPGETTKDVLVEVIGDTVEEGDETFTVELSSPPNVFVEDEFATGTIVDDDPELAIGPASAEEGDDGTTTATFPVTLDQPTTVPVTVDYATLDGTATAGEDYTAAGGTLTIPAGQTTQDIAVEVIGDTLDEDDETFTVQLSSPAGAVILGTAEGLGTIVDDDDPPPTTTPTGGGGPPQLAPASVSSPTVSAGGTMSDANGLAGVSVTTPNAGTVTILIRQADEAAPDGYVLLPLAVDISAPQASTDDPLVLVFTLPADGLPAGATAEDLIVLRDGVPLGDCPAATSGGPCVTARSTNPDTGEVTLRVITPAASTWTFGMEPVRLSGDDTVAAAIAWSQLAVDDDGADTVLLGRDDLFADSLASGPVQGVAGAPLLLTPREGLDARTAAELSRLGARDVVVLGGPAAVSEAVEADLIDLGYDVERVSGADRVGTATAVAERFFTSATSAIVARATGDPDDPTRAFADSLGAGALGAATGQPVLLTDPDGLSEATAAHLASSSITAVTIVGGTAAVTEQVADDLTALGISVERASGLDRFATAALLVERGGYERPDGVLLVDGSGDDAWASGFAAGLRAATAPLLLTDGSRVPAPTQAALADLHALGVSAAQLTCGPNVSGGGCDQALTAFALSGEG